MKNILENIFTESFFNILSIYSFRILFGLFNVGVIKYYVKGGNTSLLSGVAASIILPFFILIFMPIIQEMIISKEALAVLLILITINIVTFIRVKKKSEIRKEVDIVTVNLINTGQVTLDILKEKLAEEKEIVENGGKSKYYFDFEKIEKAIETHSSLHDFYDNVKKL